MKDWKQAERRIADILSGQRVPVSGRTRGDRPDIKHPTLSVEVKSRKSLPAWIENAMQQAKAASKNGELPVAVLHQDGERYTDALVIIRLKDFADYVKGGAAGSANIVNAPAATGSRRRAAGTGGGEDAMKRSKNDRASTT
jgi:hypothetical protein